VIKWRGYTVFCWKNNKGGRKREGEERRVTRQIIT